jgi:hypothetical protein
LKSEDPELKAQDHGCHDAKPDGPPLFRRLCVFVALFFGGFFWSLRGWEDLDPKRRLVRAAYIGSGLLLSASGLLLWLATLAFPSTWGWWL